MNVEAIINNRKNVGISIRDNYEKWLIRFARALDCENDECIISYLKNKQNLCKVFSFQKRGGVSKAQYYLIKSHIVALSEYFGIEPDVPSYEEVLDSLSVITLYKDLNSILNFIGIIEEDKQKDFLKLKKIVILGWNGLSLDEIIKLKTQDIFNEGERYFISNPKKVEISKNEYDLLLLKCKKNGLIITSTFDSEKPISQNSLITLIGRYNNLTASSGKAIIFRDLRKNALFVDIYNEESEYIGGIDSTMLRKIIKDKFRCEEKATFCLIQEYNKWKRMYYS